MLVRNKAELEAQINRNNLSKHDADMLREIYAEHERSNAEPKIKDNGFAAFEKECAADGVCSEDIKTAWDAIQRLKDRKPENAAGCISLENLINRVNND